MTQDVFKGAPHQHQLGDRVTKVSGSSWTGLVVGFYSTALTPVGYAVESETEKGSVQIYPEKALRAAPLVNQAQPTINPADLPDQGAETKAPAAAQRPATTKSLYGSVKTNGSQPAARAPAPAPAASSPAPATPSPASTAQAPASFVKPGGGSPFSRFKK